MPEDDGIVEFYGVGGLHNRGELLVGMLKVLRDDLPCDPGGLANGIGYTVVAWTHDGENWLRERVPLLDRDHSPQAWDHAHAWVDVQLPVGDEVLLYYGGYKSGHKPKPLEERQVGLVKMKRDRYVARQAGAEPGRLLTPPVILEADRMSVNVEPAAGGEVRVQVTGSDGKPIEGFHFDDCQPVTTDAVAAPVQWKRSLGELNGRPVRLEFSLKLARLYAFDLQQAHGFGMNSKISMLSACGTGIRPVWKNSAIVRSRPSSAARLVGVFPVLTNSRYTPIRPSFHRPVVVSAPLSIFRETLTQPVPITAYIASIPWMP
jgi:hypothetical protein